MHCGSGVTACHFIKTSVLHVFFLLLQAPITNIVTLWDQNEAFFVQIAPIFSATFCIFSSSTDNIFMFLFNRVGFWKASLKIRNRRGCCNHLASFLGMLVSSARFMCDCDQKVKAWKCFSPNILNKFNTYIEDRVMRQQNDISIWFRFTENVEVTWKILNPIFYA